MKVDTLLKTIDGIPFFSQDRYWGKAPKAVLEQALDVLDREGWSVFKERYGGKFDFTFEENRADWRFPLTITKDSAVLDIGAGMGRSSIPLARVAGKVVAVDQSFLRMKFLKKRAEAERLTNIEVYVGDLFDLPFKSESFDVIAMNGVLEWVGLTDRYDHPREAQLAALRRCRELLKPGGYLYVGIENRFAAAYTRAIDHSGLRFTSYMPRWLANAYMHLRKGKPYRTYTYTAVGYKKLLREAGFGGADFYLAYPGYNFPRILIPHDELPVLGYVVRALMPSTTFVQRLIKIIARVPLLLRAYRAVFFSFDIYAPK